MTTIKKTTAKKTKKSRKKSDIKPYRLGDYAGIGYTAGAERYAGNRRTCADSVDCPIPYIQSRGIA